MKAWEEYAFIRDGRVQNIAVYPISGGAYTCANATAKEIYGADAFAENVTQYPVYIGCFYEDGEFYHNTEEKKGERIMPVPTDEEEVEILKREQGDTDSVMLDHEERLILLEVGE